MIGNMLGQSRQFRNWIHWQSVTRCEYGIARAAPRRYISSTPESVDTETGLQRGPGMLPNERQGMEGNKNRHRFVFI